MKYQEFLDHLLGVYYYTSKSNPKVALTPFWIVDMIQEGYSSSDVHDIMNYLGAEGYLLHYQQRSGNVSKITPSGKMYFESLGKKYINQIEQFLVEKGILEVVRNFKSVDDSDALNKNHPNELIEEIETELEQLQGIDKDLIEDIKIIKLEFQKRSPNQEILRMKIEDLLEENILFSKIQELKYRLSL